jgi:two-component system, NtrC family, sensor kinase
MIPSVLIVDDSLTVRMDLAEAFGKAGFRPIPCGSVREANDVLERERVDIAILDVILPDGDGVQLLEIVRAATADRKVPILMLSSEVDVHDRIRGLKTGADEYVGKPYDVGYVVARARELLGDSLGARATSAPILLIDDSPTFRAALGNALEGEGYRVVAAGSGEEGLKLAARERPGALIVDGVLPGMDGAAVIRHVRLDSALRGVPCLMLTEAHEIEQELRALDSGADAFVHKSEELPVALAKLRALLRAASDTAANTETRSLLGPRRVLAVDDSATFRATLSQALLSEGYDVVQASSGEEALELISVQPVDCVLLDLIMPGIGGRETCRTIKASPVARDIPVLVLTSLEDRGAMLEALAMGADDFIQKTSELDVLKARVRAQLRRRQFEDETRRVREQLLRSEIQAAEARTAQQLAEAKVMLLETVEQKNRELGEAYRELQATQTQLVQSAKMASLGGLVAGIAHEINNPLAFSLSHLETAKKSLDRVEQALLTVIQPEAKGHWDRAADRLREMSIGLERIRELVVKLRTFSRIDEGEFKRVSVADSLESVLTILQHRMRGRITVERHYDAPDDIECYPSLLNQAVMNLVANSIDAIKGNGTISLSTSVSGERYSIRVADTGAGIPPEHRERLFEPFFTTKEVGAGTGLGLSITYAIVRKHGGALRVEHPVEGGTAMTIELPWSERSEG